MNSGRPIMSDAACDQSWNCGDDGLLAKLGNKPRLDEPHSIWTHTRRSIISCGVWAARSFQHARMRSSMARRGRRAPA